MELSSINFLIIIPAMPGFFALWAGDIFALTGREENGIILKR
jgi:hypothetical protein